MNPRCPICGAASPPPGGNPHRPFCSSRCKMIDLDRWLSGDYRIPGEPVPDQEPQREVEAPGPDAN
jgi:uncharacterized protein